MPAFAVPDQVLNADPVPRTGFTRHLHLTIRVFDYDEAVA